MGGYHGGRLGGTSPEDQEQCIQVLRGEQRVWEAKQIINSIHIHQQHTNTKYYSIGTSRIKWPFTGKAGGIEVRINERSGTRVATFFGVRLKISCLSTLDENIIVKRAPL